jgi:hypothetical protein
MRIVRRKDTRRVAIMRVIGTLWYAEDEDKCLYPELGETKDAFEARLRREGYTYVFEVFEKREAERE